MKPHELIRRIEEGEHWEIWREFQRNSGGWPVFRALKRLALEHPDPLVRYNAIYCLQSHPHARAALETLLDVAENQQEYPEIRGQALENVGSALMLEGHKRHSLVQRIIGLLGDPEADVRFWAIYALWQMRARIAIPILERMTDDLGKPHRFWTVGEEASDALGELRDGRPSADRQTHYCPFSWESQDRRLPIIR